MSLGHEPLLVGGTDTVSEVRSPRFSLVTFTLQTCMITACMILSFVLPHQSMDMTQAVEVAAMHAIMSLIVAFFSLLVSRSLDGVGVLPSFFPVTAAFASVIVYVLSITNSLMLIFLGIESWCRNRMGYKFSLLNIIQLFVCIELGVIFILVLRVIYRGIQYRKLQGETVFPVKPLSTYQSPFPQRAMSRVDGMGLLSPLAKMSFSDMASFPVDIPEAGGINSPPPYGGSTRNNGLIDRVRELESREERLLEEMQRLATQVDGLLRSPADHDVRGVLKSALDDVRRLTEDNRRLAAKSIELEERGSYLESELRRASTDVQKLRQALKEERKKTDKLYATLDMEREANAQAQNAISDLKSKISVPTREPSFVTGSFNPPVGSLPIAASRMTIGSLPNTSNVGSYLGPSRANSMSRASFAAVLSPGMHSRRSSRADLVREEDSE